MELNDEAWNWIQDSTQRVQNTETRLSAFKILDSADPLRFGRTLFTGGWSWSPTDDMWVNHYGADALIEATYETAFDQIASRIAPWRVLEVARKRGSRPAEVQLAVELFGRVLMDSALDLPDAGAELSVDRFQREFLPFAYSVSPPPNQSGGEIRWPTMDAEKQLEAYRSVLNAANMHIRDAWRAGASLYLIDVHVEDFMAVLIHAPGVIDQWLAGWSEATSEFTRRVRLAEGVFLGLCEALMAHDPHRGTRLWRTLRLALTTKYFGKGGVEELLHMAYRVPDSPEVAALRCELLGLEYCHTDQGLFDIALAASYNGKVDWLVSMISSDRASSAAWKRKRAEVLAGFTIHNRLPVEGACPEGEITTGTAELLVKSARSKWIEACAHHWWDAFLQATDPDQAYAAWVLFLRSADRRSRTWTSNEPITGGEMSGFFALKLVHSKLNQNAIRRAFEKRDEELERSFLRRSIVAGVGPWANQRIH